MIILDEGQQRAKLRSFVAGPTIRLPDRVVGHSSAPLPDYETSQAQHLTFRKPTFRHWVDSRFWRATFYALVVYLALSVVVGVPLIIVKVLRGSSWHPSPLSSLSWVDDDTTSANPPNFDPEILVGAETTVCNSWDSMDISPPSHGIFTASAHYSLSASGLFSIRSNVSESSDLARGVTGNFTVDINTDSNATKALFSVILHSSSADLRRRTNICFHSTGNDRGLSIFVPNNLTHNNSLTFDIHLLFPKKPSPLRVEKLVTYLPKFLQNFGHLDQHIIFGTINVEGASSDVVVDSMRGDTILIKTSLASIWGTFNVSESLRLDTIGGPIYANITLVHESTREEPTLLSLDTGNSRIEAQVLLLAPLVHSILHRPFRNFNAHVKTFNGPIKVDISHNLSTYPAPLHLQVQNSLAESNVTVDSKYQGTFDVQTKLAPAIVREGVSDPIADPPGDNREINYIYGYKSPTRTFGWVGRGKRPIYWDPAVEGHIEVVSSLSPVLLQLGDTRTV